MKAVVDRDKLKDRHNRPDGCICVHDLLLGLARHTQNPFCVQDIERALMKADVDRDKLKDRHNRPDAVAKGLELNDASRVQRRGKMMLPAPQVSEQELQQIARGGADVDMDPELAEGGTDATRRLLGDYQTPQR